MLRLVSVVFVVGTLWTVLYTGGGVDCQQRIVGGYSIPAGRWPMVVALMSNDEAFCVGMIIRKRVVLTAAHCL